MVIKKRKRILAFGFLIVGSIVLVVWIINLLLAKPETEAPGNQVLSFNPPGCSLPCVIGITPGKTTFEQALKIAASSVPDNQIISDNEFWIEAKGKSIRIFITLELQDPRLEYLQQITLSTHGNGSITSLGNLLDAGYVPEQVFRSRASGPDTVALLLTFSNQPQVIVQITGYGQVEYSSPVMDIIIVDGKYRPYLLELIRAKRHFEDEVTWLGFTSVKEYQQIPPG